MARPPNDPIDLGYIDYLTKFISATGKVVEVAKASLWVTRWPTDATPDSYDWGIFIIGPEAKEFVAGDDYDIVVNDFKHRERRYGKVQCKAVAVSEGRERADFEKRCSFNMTFSKMPPEPEDVQPT